MHQQMRIAHLTTSPLLAGIYGCSPTGNGFRFGVSELNIRYGLPRQLPVTFPVFARHERVH